MMMLGFNWEEEGAKEWYLPGYGREGVAPYQEIDVSIPRLEHFRDVETSQALPSREDQIVAKHDSTAVKTKEPLEGASNRSHVIRVGPNQPRGSSRREHLPVRCRTQSGSSGTAGRAGLRARSSGQSRRWVKVTPFLDKKDADLQSKAEEHAVLAELRREPQDPSNLSNHLAFIWPSDVPSVQEVLGDNLEKLDSIRMNFGAHVYLQTEREDREFHNDCIRAVGPDEAPMTYIVDELRKLCKDALSKSDIRIRAHLVEPPPAVLMKEKIILLETERFSRPYLFGKVSDATRWEAVSEMIPESRQLHERNHSRLLDSVQKFLSNMHLFSDSLRMRVHFGTFMLTRFPKYKDDGLKYYIDEFGERLHHERVQGRVVPGFDVDQESLLQRFTKATELLEPIHSAVNLRSLKHIDPIFSASFEFSSMVKRPLRLEVYFERPSGSREIEIRGHAWFKARAGEDFSLRLPLQLSVIDFTKSDWQLDVEFFEMPEANTIKDFMNEFLMSVKFKASSQDCSIASKPFRKIEYQAGAPLIDVIEKAAIRFKIKGTGYVLEVARFDHYAGYSGTMPQKISWGATLFNPTWDSMLKRSPKASSEKTVQGSFNAPEKARVGELKAFFPPKHSGQTQDDHSFEELLKITRRISELLRPGQGSSKVSEKKPGGKGLLDVELGTLF